MFLHPIFVDVINNIAKFFFFLFWNLSFSLLATAKSSGYSLDINSTVLVTACLLTKNGIFFGALKYWVGVGTL